METVNNYTVLQIIKKYKEVIGTNAEDILLRCV